MQEWQKYNDTKERDSVFFDRNEPYFVAYLGRVGLEPKASDEQIQAAMEADFAENGVVSVTIPE